MKKRKIAVIGLGPAGGILAAHLAASGHLVYGIDLLEEYNEVIRKKGITITQFVSLHSRLQAVSTHLEQLPEKEFDYVVLAVKTPNMPGIVSYLQKFAGNFQVVVLQNGLDNEEYLVDFFPRERILRVAVNYAGNIVTAGMISMSFFRKPNQVGCICSDSHCGHAQDIAEIMTAAGLETEAVGDIRTFTLKKVILHAILAPVSAVLGVTMAEVMNHKGSRAIVDALIRECIAVAKAMGYDYGPDFFDYCVDFLLKAGHHKPSMLIDLEKGNPTEIEYIGGKIVSLGEKYHVPIPVNTTITQLVRAKEYYGITRRL